MSLTGQDEGRPEREMVTLFETVRQLCGAVQLLTESVVKEQERVTAADNAKAAALEALKLADAAIEQQWHHAMAMEARLHEWEVPPVCSCGRNGYEVWCKCGKRLK